MSLSATAVPRRVLLLGASVSLAVAACTATDESADRPPGSPSASNADTTSATITMGTTSTIASSTTATTTATTTTTLAPTTTIAPTAEVVAETCDSLRTDGLETRRTVIDALPDRFAAADGDGDGRAAVAAACGDELDRLDGAVEIRARMEAIGAAEDDDRFAYSLTDFSCDPGTFEVTVTNDSATPLGVHANFSMYLDGDQGDSVQSSFAPIVVWSIDPGASELITGRFTHLPDSQVACGFEAQVFDADPSDADASIDTTPEYPMLTGDDPAVWFLALVDVEGAARTSGDVDLAAVTEDVRSMAYDKVARSIAEGDAFPDIELIEVCERGRSAPDADHIGFVFRQRWPSGTEDGRIAPGETTMHHGLFRRGDDGQWRWLSTARYYESLASDDCSGVAP